MIQLIKNQQFIKSTLQEQLLADVYKIFGVLKGNLKNFANFTEKYMCRASCERKSLALCIQHAPLL